MGPIWVAHEGLKRQPIKIPHGNVGWGITENSKSEKPQHWCRLKTECTCIYGFKVMSVPASPHSGPEDCQQGILGNQFKNRIHSIWTKTNLKLPTYRDQLSHYISGMQNISSASRKWVFKQNKLISGITFIASWAMYSTFKPFLKTKFTVGLFLKVNINLRKGSLSFWIE